MKIERLAGWLLPPSARESVLGDFRERYQSPGQYIWEALRTIPLVVLSRMRRTTDPQALLTEALGLYLAWLLSGWLLDRAFLAQPWALLKLAGPAMVAMTAMLLGDAWTPQGQRREPLIRAIHGACWALLSQVLAQQLPPDVIALGLGLAMLTTTAVGWISPVIPGAPLLWEDHVIRVTEIVVGVIVVGAASTWVAPLVLRLP